MNCPRCYANWKQYKAGFNPSGSQRYRCGECNRVYTPKPTQRGYPEETRLLAIRMYVEGSSYGSIGRILKVNPQSVANWVSQYTAKLPQAPMPAKVKKAELDELYTFVGKKKRYSTFWQSWIEILAVFWVGMWCWKERRKPCKPAWNVHHRLHNITAMLFLSMTLCTMVLLMKCALTNRRPTQSRRSMLIYGIT